MTRRTEFPWSALEKFGLHSFYTTEQISETHSKIDLLVEKTV